MLNPYGSGDFFISGKSGCRFHKVTGKYSLHQGVDLCGITTKKVVAIKDGYVKTVCRDQSSPLGIYVEVLGFDGCSVRYCRLASALPSEGEKISTGDAIGYEGLWGAEEKGQHLHLEVVRGKGQLNAAEYIGIPNKIDTVRGVLPPPARHTIRRGASVRVIKPVLYGSGLPFPTVYPYYEVLQIIGKCAIIGINGKPTATVEINNIEAIR